MTHKPTEKTEETVERMCQVGISQDDIARVIGIDAKTLREHYRKILDSAMTIANAGVAGELYKKCMSGDTTAMIFWCKTRLKWKEITVNEIDPSDRFMQALKEEAQKDFKEDDQRDEFDD